MNGRKFALRFGAAAALLCGICLSADAETIPPVEAFAVLPAHPPQISPDGKRFALIRDINGRPAVAVYKIDTPQEPPQIVTSDDWIIEYMRWIKNDALIIYDTKNMKIGVYDRFSSDLLRPLGDAAAALLNERKLVQLTAYAQIIDIDLDSPDTVYAIYQNSVYSMNVRTGANATPFVKHYVGPATSGGFYRHDDPINLGGDIAIKWFMDGHGKVLARVDSFRDRASYDSPLWHRTLKVLEGDDWRTLGTYDATVDVDDGIAGVSEDGGAIIRLAPRPDGTNSVDRIDLKSGAETTIFRNPKYDVRDTLHDDWTGKVIGYVVDEDMPVYRYLDPKREALQKGLEAAFPGLSVHPVSTDLAGDRSIVEVVGPKMPESYYLYDRTTHHATAVAASYPDLTERELGDVKPYGYAARDGLPVPAYLTLPPGRNPHNLPLVVMPHGGPDSRDDMSFDFMSQFLASRGYAVLRPEFRGSAGYGRPFTVAGLHQWGLKMQDDISDGVKKVIADGIADPKRVCIFGASYGGYAALVGATLTPELYACVISFAGISDLPNILGYDRRQFGEDASHGSWTTTRMGDLFTDSAQLDATSPALHADRVRAPVLLLHSELDVTVPIAQSVLMYNALKEAGKKVEFVRVPGDDHYLRLEQTRLRVLQEVEKFLGANIGAETSVTAAK